jgi:L-ascorbate metabolism protein UlaG (beta-lactamase superfamily)
MRFRNLDPRHRGPSTWAAFRWAIGDRLIGKRKPAPPGRPAPFVAPDLPLIESRDAGPRITWIGHSSFLVQLDGQNLLIDPVFSDRIARFFPRHVAPGLKPDELPPIDAVLISHSHHDHLDLPSIEATHQDATGIVPLGLGRHLTKRLYARVVELNWWESTALGDIKVTFVPSRHWSRRTLWDTNRTLWGGYVIESPEANVYFSGDSAWCDIFTEVGRRVPDLAAALIPIGSYEPQWFMSHNHLNPEEAAQAFLDSGARLLIPAHWGTFQIADEPLCEPMERLEAWWATNRPPGRRLARLAVGETVRITAPDDASCRALAPRVP